MKKIIGILLYMTMSLTSMGQTSTITLTSVKQYIRGFGGINLPEWQGSDLTTAQRNTAFGNGSDQIGMSVLRIYVSDNPNDWSKALATAKVAISMGLTVFATPWNPPVSMCETVTRNNRQEKRLKYASYSDYAQHLIDFNNYMKNNGVNLYAMSFANEPDWGFDWTWYSIDEVYNFVTSQTAKLRVNGVKVITAESFSYNKTYYDKILNDPSALANIDIIGCHLYGSDASSPNSFFQYPLADQLAAGKERWVTEHYTDSNNDANLWPMAHDVSYEIYRSMVEGQMSVYTWWYIRRSYGPIKEDGTVSKRGYCMSQYSKFIRPGYVRVDATKNPTTDVYVSAYKKGDDVVIVAVNRATSTKTITFSIPGTKVVSWDKYVTSGTKNVAKESSINASSGSFQITLDAQSTTTFVGIAPVGTPTASITASGSTTFCAGGNVILNANTGTGYSYQWKLNGINITNATSSSYTATQSGSYTVTVTANSQTATSNIIVVTANSIPVAPTVTATQIYCQNVPAIPLTANGNNLKWYSASSGGTASTTAPTPTTTTAGTTNYYVSQTTNNCEGPRATIAATVNALPSAPTTNTSVTYCQNASPIPLAATGNNLKWYTVASGGTASATAQTPSTATAGMTNYYVSQTTNNCEGPRAMITVTVNALPVLTAYTQVDGGAWNQTSSVTVCAGSTIVLGPQPTSATGWSWTGPSGYSATSREITLSTLTTMQAGSYTATYTDGNSCKASTVYTVAVNALPAAPTVTATQTYCQNATASQLTATGTNLKWYTQAMGGTASTTAPTPTTTASGTTNYYVSQTTNNCEGSRANIAVTVNSLPIATISTNTPTTFCAGGSIVLTASAGASYKWFNGTTQIGTNSNYIATSSGNYSVEVTNAMGCKATSSVTTVTVNALPAASITANGPTTFTQGGNVVLSANTGTGLSYQWFNGLVQVGTGSSYTATIGGDYTVEVTNGAGCKATSSVTRVTVNGNQAPSVNITFPFNNASFTSPANVILTATATDVDGTVIKVDFYFGNTLLGTDPTAPYDFAMNNLGVGSYTITAVATDNLGAPTTSAAITFTVINPLPTINITAPLNGNSFVENATVTLNADASDVNGTIAKVEFYNGNTLLGTDDSSPYTFIWSNVLAGTYDITAKATDNDGGVATSSVVTITVTANQPSIITITSPTPNTTIVGAITITANVSDPDGGITLVEFLDGTTVIGTTTTAPYSFTWVDPSAGDHSISVRVTDSNGGVTISTPIIFTSETPSGIQSTNTIYGAVYPNPSSGHVYIDSNKNLSNANFSIVDVLGKEVSLSATFEGTRAKVDVSGLSNGTYILIVKEGNLILRKKMTVVGR